MHTSEVALRRPHVVLAAVVAVLAAAASGCGSSGIAVPELTSFTQAAQSSSAADTAKFSLTLDATIPGLGRELSLSADGGFDTPSKRAQLKVDLSSLAELMKGLGAGLGGQVQGDLGSPDDWKLEAIQDGDTAYIRFPLLAKRLPSGKTWVKGDAKGLSGPGTGQLGRLGSFAGTDPRSIFEMLKAVSGSIEAVGSEKVRDVETSHYRATIDFAKLQQLVPADKQQSLGGVDQAAKQAGVQQLPVDIWIDAEQRVRKIAVDLDAKQPGTGTPIKASLVVEFYDYGTPLDLQLPPADQVVDAASLQQPQ